MKNRSQDQEILEVRDTKGVPIFPVRKGQAGNNISVSDISSSVMTYWQLFYVKLL